MTYTNDLQKHFARHAARAETEADNARLAEELATKLSEAQQHIEHLEQQVEEMQARGEEQEGTIEQQKVIIERLEQQVRPQETQQNGKAHSH